MSRSFNLKYNRGGEIIEIIIRDSSGAKIDTFKCSINDFPKIIKIIERKYGIKVYPKKDRDIDWLRGDYPF